MAKCKGSSERRGPSRPGVTFNGLCRLAGVITGIVLFSAGCPKNPHDITGTDNTDTLGDTTRPSRVVDLRTSGQTPVSATLCWTAPGDDGTVGTASEYLLRLSTDSIIETNFDSANSCWVDWPLAHGETQCQSIYNLVGDSTYWVAIKTRDERNNWSDLSNVVRLTCPTDSIRTFPDSSLELAVRRAIRVPSEPIRQSRLDSLKLLNAEYMHVSNLSGIQNCRYLLHLVLRSNKIADISLLSGIAPLRHLNLTDNLVTDITALGSLSLLDTLYLGENPVSDLSAIAGLTQLHDLAVHSTGVSDLSPISGMVSLTRLNVGACPIAHPAYLSQLVNVSDLQAYACNLTDISFLASMTKLHDLGLAFNKILDISPLENLDSLGSLSLYSNQITNLLPLVNNGGIGAGDGIDVSLNPLSDSSKGTYIPQLQARGVTVIW